MACLISLPSAGAVRGLLINAFYFSPGQGGNGERLRAAVQCAARGGGEAFPEFAGKHTVNGHLRRLARLSDETGEDSARRKTLLMCTGGTAV